MLAWIVIRKPIKLVIYCFPHFYKKTVKSRHCLIKAGAPIDLIFECLGDFWEYEFKILYCS